MKPPDIADRDDHRNPLALTPTADALRLLRFCPERFLVTHAAGPIGRTLLRILDPLTGLWTQGEGALGDSIESSVEAWLGGLTARDGWQTLEDQEAIALREWTRRTCSPTGRRDLLESVAVALQILQRTDQLNELVDRGLMVHHEEEVNRNLQYLGTASGVVDIYTGRLLSPVEGRQHLVAMTTGVEYQAGAHREDTAAGRAVRQLVAHLPPEDRTRIEGFLGQAMRGRPNGWAWLIGPAGSGKKTLLTAVRSTLGEYAFSIPDSVLFRPHRSKLSDNQRRIIRRFCRGARIAVAKLPVASADLNYRLLKRIAAGEEIEDLDADHLHAGSDTITASLMLAFDEGQHLQPTPVAGEAMRHIHVLQYAPIPSSERKSLDFRTAFQADTSMKVATLAWLIEAAMMHDVIPADSADSQAMLMAIHRSSVSGAVYEWLTSRLLYTGSPADRVSTREVWEAALHSDHVDEG